MWISGGGGLQQKCKGMTTRVFFDVLTESLKCRLRMAIFIFLLPLFVAKVLNVFLIFSMKLWNNCGGSVLLPFFMRLLNTQLFNLLTRAFIAFIYRGHQYLFGIIAVSWDIRPS